MKQITAILFSCILFLLFLHPVTGFCIEIGPVDIHGFLSQGYLKSSDNNYMAETKKGTFAYREYGLNFNYNLFPNLRFAGQVFGKELGTFNNDEIVIDWFLVDYSFSKWAGIRIGKLKAPLGFYNSIRDYEMLRVSTLMPQSVYIELNRDSYSNLEGGEFYGAFNIPRLGLVDYSIMAGSQEIKDSSGTNMRLQEVAPLTQTSFRFESSTSKRQIAVKIDNLFTLSGLTYQFYIMRVTDMYTDGKWAIPGTPLFGQVLELEYTHFQPFTHSLKYSIGDLSIMAEYLKREMRYIMLGSESESNAVGWYYGFEYQLFDQFAFGGYWSELYNNEDVKDDPREYNKDLAISFKYDVNYNVIVKAEIHKMDGVAGTTNELLGTVIGSTGQPEPVFEKDWMLYAFKVCFSF